jgi:hypothetical protein
VGSYLVESYLSRASAGEPATTAARVRRAAADLSREGFAVRYVRSFFLPEDETCFHFFEGASAEAIGEVTARASIACDRIVEVRE